MPATADSALKAQLMTSLLHSVTSMSSAIVVPMPAARSVCASASLAGEAPIARSPPP